MKYIVYLLTYYSSVTKVTKAIKFFFIHAVLYYDLFGVFSP